MLRNTSVHPCFVLCVWCHLVEFLQWSLRHTAEYFVSVSVMCMCCFCTHSLLQILRDRNLVVSDLGIAGPQFFKKYYDCERIHTPLAVLNLLCQLPTRICCYHFSEENGTNLFSIKTHHIIVKLIRSVSLLWKECGFSILLILLSTNVKACFAQ